MNRFILSLFLPVLLFAELDSTAQTTRRVLFLGNSYTGVNNLPQIIKDVALSAGDTLIFDSHTPGGYTLEDHTLNSVTEGKIMAGGRDYVVLQGQSREPILHTSRFKQTGNQLNNLIRQHNPCAVTMLYMTWGRKNGDSTYCASFPAMCTYEKMDSTLRVKYTDLASSIRGEVSPVSVVWNHLRQNNPGIELYSPDESHPSAAGSYAAACTFYTAIFKKDPTSITFDYGLNASDASAIRNAVKTQVFDSLDLWDHYQPPQSNINYSIGPGTNEVFFNAVYSGGSETYFWDFGDGNTSTVSGPTHSYASDGTYTVTLATTNCNLQGLHTDTADTVIEFCSHTPVVTISKPWLCHYDTLWTQAADSYQWYANGSPIPETGQYLANYQQYNSFNFSVRTTVNGCSELSEEYYANPPWTGYYFDAAWGGDPCEGDTALFIALHTGGSIPDSANIYWYRNGTLLSSENNKDTLFITTGGTYESKVVEPYSDCPLDTTASGPVEYDCGTTGIEKENDPEVFWNIYPNPASGVITVAFANHIERENIQIFSAVGRLVKVTKAAPTTRIDVSDLPNGMYYIRLGSNPRAVKKFIKQ